MDFVNALHNLASKENYLLLYAWKKGTDFGRDTIVERFAPFVEGYDGDPQEFIAEHHDKNLYFGNCLFATPESGKARARGVADDARALPWLFADLDADDGVHSSGNCAPRKALKSMLSKGEVVPVPSVVVDSGGGYHAYWLLEEPIYLDTPEDRQQAKNLLAILNDRLQDWHRAKDYDYRRLESFTQILRVPETLNFKGDKPTKVTMVWPKGDATPVYFSADALATALAAGATKQTADATEDTVSEFAIIVPQADAKAAAIDACSRIPANWGNDASTYVISCCGVCVKYGCTVETTVEVVREMEATKGPFPKNWTDKQIAKRFTDASKKNVSGSAFGERDKCSKADPRDVAQWMVESSRHSDGAATIRWHRGQMLEWMDGRYHPLQDSEDKAKITNMMNERFTYVLPGHVQSVRNQLRAATILPSKLSSPAWVDSDNAWSPKECLATDDKIIHLPGLVAGEPGSIIDATPTYFSEVATDYSWSASNPGCPKWMTFLKQLWPDDPESIDLLQKWFGYCLTQDTSKDKMLLFIGPTRSGKGTISRVISSLIGVANVTGPSLTSLTGEFGLQPLLGKSLAIVADVRIGHKVDQSVLAEKLLKISSGDVSTVNVKFKDQVEDRLPTRLMLLSNELPCFTDASGAIAGRFMVLQTSFSAYGSEVTDLSDRLIGELQGILHWAIAGYDKLQQEGFIMPASSKEYANQLKELACTVGTFVSDRCEVGSSFGICQQELFGAYQSWAIRSGHKPRSKSVFTRDLKAASTNVKDGRESTGDRRRTYQGIRLVGTDAELAPDAAIEFSVVS